MLRPITRALLSVYDKTGLLDLARGLADLGVELVSTGGTHKSLADAGLAVREVADLTGFPEMLDGRVKTLHPRVHAGILARRDDPDHQATMAEHQLPLIDLVVCNLYPFEKVIDQTDRSPDEVIEFIDVGGPTMVRAAAKNHAGVAVLTSPEQYADVLEELTRHKGLLGGATRERLALAAFARTASYDAAIAAWMAKQAARGPAAEMPATLVLRFDRKSTLRYGENPHQKAAFYAEPMARHACVTRAETLHGKELSYNNLLDLDSALNLVREFAEPAAAVIKHNNPCGAAVAATLEEAFQRAYEGDPQSAFGGILGFNRVVDEATAWQVTEPNRFVECVIAPDFAPEAFQMLTTRPSWKKSVRLLKTGPLSAGAEEPERQLDFRRVDGGLLVQERDARRDDPNTWSVVTKRLPTEEELEDLRFAWVVCKHVKSNAIVLAKGGKVIGVGAGQMSRVDSVRIAITKAEGRVRGAVLASDAFFPFRDNVDSAAAAGVTAVIQPGGSVRDAESIAACEERGLAMVFTGTRHFRH